MSHSTPVGRSGVFMSVDKPSPAPQHGIPMNTLNLKIPKSLFHTMYLTWFGLALFSNVYVDLWGYSHFCPRQELILEKRFTYDQHVPKISGSQLLEEQIRRLHPTCHVFGHTHVGWDTSLAPGHKSRCFLHPMPYLLHGGTMERVFLRFINEYQ